MSSSHTARICELVADALGLDLADLPATASMESISAWDSLQHLGVITALEAELGWELSAEEIPTLSSIAAIVARLESEAT